MNIRKIEQATYYISIIASMLVYKFCVVGQILLLLSIAIDGSAGDCSYDKNCGKFHEGSRRGENVVVGGNETGYFKYPWMAIIYRQHNENKIQPFCGGTLISPKHVITAAHCVAFLSWRDLGVLLGAYDWCDAKEQGHQHFHVKNVNLHPDFGDETDDGALIVVNDIAVVELDRVTELDIVCLPCRSPRDNDPLMAIGWGSTSPESNEMSCKQMWTVFRVVDSKECNDLYWICSDSDQAATCNGDSGGPGLVMNEHGHYVLSGVLQAGPVTCQFGADYEIFVEVVEYMPWINGIIRH